MTEQDLLELKEKIEAAKSEASELKGQRTALLKQLKESYGCETVEEAEKKLARLKRELTLLKDKFNEGVAELEASLEEQNE